MRKLQLKNINFVVIIFLCISGCASSPSQQSMSINTMDLVESNKNLVGNVNIRSVTGGEVTNPLWISKVDNRGLKAALDQSLAVIGYKSQNPRAPYQVDVILEDLDQPSFGLTFNVSSRITYNVDKGNETTSFPVNAIGSAKTSDAIIGTERMKIANERSIKNNIKEFINQISNYY